LTASCSLLACGNALNCAISGDNLKGHVTFASGVSVQAGANLVVQYSTDSFVSVAKSTIKTNEQGLVAFPYGMCVPENTDVQVRAFQDLNLNGTIDSGDAQGRHDGTDTGNAAFVSKKVTDDASGNAVELTGVDIVVDTP
jgi:hypothetical protein